MNYATVRQKLREGASKGWAAFKAELGGLGLEVGKIASQKSGKALGAAVGLALSGATLAACPDSSSTADKPKCEGELCIADVNGGGFTQGDAVAKDCKGDQCSTNPRAGVDVYLDVVSGKDGSAATGDGNAPPKPDSKSDAKPSQTGDGVVSDEETTTPPQVDTTEGGTDGGKPPQGADTSYPPQTVDGEQYVGADTSTPIETSQPPVVEEECGGSMITKMYQIKVGPDATDAAVYVEGTLEYNGVAYKISAIDENPDGTVTIHLEGTQDELKTQLFGTYEVKNEFEGTATYTQKGVLEAFGTTMGAVPQRLVFDEKDCSSEHEFYGVMTGAAVFVSLDCEQQADGAYKATRDENGNLMMKFDAIDGASWVWGSASLAENYVISTGTEVIFVTVLVGSPVHGNPNCKVPKAGVELTYANNDYTWVLAEGTSTGIPTTDGKTVTVSVLHAIPKEGVVADTGVPTEYVGCATLVVSTPKGDAAQTQCSFDEGAFSRDRACDNYCVVQNKEHSPC